MNAQGTFSVRTPEGIVFSFPLAGLPRRFLAWLIDAIFISVLTAAVGLALTPLSLVGDLYSALLIAAMFLLSLGYPVIFELLWRGVSPGKRVMRIRVMDAAGMRLRFDQVLIRNLLRAVDTLPSFYLVGAAVMFFNARSCRLGDIAAGTVVVAVPRVEEPDLSRLGENKYNSLAAYPHLFTKLRRAVSPAETMIAFDALIRRDAMDDASRIAVFASIAGHFRRITEFPDEAVFGVSDEQYVRNIVDILLKK